jgi:hypothetical protein
MTPITQPAGAVRGAAISFMRLVYPPGRPD